MLFREELYLQARMIDAHGATIDRFYVPHSQRGGGTGRSYYQRWEAALPKEVWYIEIWASDAIGFWEKMGYVPKYPNLPRNDADGMTMIKRLR
jgi:hypothetical protein